MSGAPMFLYSLPGRFDTAAQHILKLIADDAGTLQERGKEQSRSSISGSESAGATRIRPVNSTYGNQHRHSAPI